MKKGGEKIRRIAKITAIISVSIILAIPVIGATTNSPNSYDHSCCIGTAYGEIEDYKLSPIAQLMILLRGKPSTLLITRGTLVIRQEPDMLSLVLTNPIKHYCRDYYGNITIHFYASIETINLDAVNECPNCSYIICSGIFGHIHIEQN